MTEIFAVILIFSGLIFFIAGSIGLLRLPDAYSRLHALTKADNVGLGFLAFGLLLLSSNSLTAFKMVLVWMLVMVSSAAGAHLIAQFVRRRERGVSPAPIFCGQGRIPRAAPSRLGPCWPLPASCCASLDIPRAAFPGKPPCAA